MIKIIDNFLTKSYYKDILELVTSNSFGWLYKDNITDPSRSIGFNEYGFEHPFWDKELGPIGQYQSYMQPLLFQIMDVVNCDFIVRARVDMVTWSSKEDNIHLAHTDFPFPNTASVFYVNETDGDTIFYNVKPDDVPKDKVLKEYERVSPKANRLVLFDGNLLHTGCSPTKHKNRILINSNYIKKEYMEEFKTFVENKKTGH